MFIVTTLLLVHAQAGPTCSDYDTANTCNNSTTLPCLWQPTCVNAGTPCSSITDPNSCNTQAPCYYDGTACMDSCLSVDLTSCSSHANCTVGDSCTSTSCSALSFSACPSACFANQYCGPTTDDSCIMHSSTVCANSPSCLWLNNTCQSPCWSQDLPSCTAMQGCKLTSTCADQGPTCQQTANPQDCWVQPNCDWSNSQCSINCANELTQLGCSENPLGYCSWTSGCTQLNSCDGFSDAGSCNAQLSCLWAFGSCEPTCTSIEDEGSCRSSACAWQGSCSTNFNSLECYQITDAADCLDTSNKRFCGYTSFCYPKVPRCSNFQIDEADCALLPNCKWVNTNTTQYWQPSYCTDLCYDLDASTCSSNPNCYVQGSCNSAIPVCWTFSEQECANADQYCQYTPSCVLSAGQQEGLELECQGIQNATDCWANSACVFGAGRCIAFCASKQHQDQCRAAGGGCEWRASCSLRQISGTPPINDPTMCSIYSSPIFPITMSPCSNHACSSQWGYALLTQDCINSTKTYCCGTNSSTCARDNQCFEHYFGDDPLCPWTCEFTPLYTALCPALGPCSTASVAYNNSEDFNNAATALDKFDMRLEAIGMPSPVYNNGALCANQSVSAVIWADDLNGDLATTIEFDFWTNDMYVPFALTFLSEPVLKNATNPQDLMQCMYFAACQWSSEVGSGCNLKLGASLGSDFMYGLASAIGPWVNLQPGVSYHVRVDKSGNDVYTLTISGAAIQSASVGPVPLGRKFSRFGFLFTQYNPTNYACIDNLSVKSSTCPSGKFSTAAPVGAVPTSSPVSRAPTTNPTPPPVPTTYAPTHSPVTHSSTNSPSTLAPSSTRAPSRSPTTAAPSLSPTTAAPSFSPTTGNPSTASFTSKPTTIAPSGPPSTQAPTSQTVAPTTQAPTQTKSASATLRPCLAIFCMSIVLLL